MPISVKSTDLSFFQNYKMNPSDKSMDEFEHSSSSTSSTNAQISISSAAINANFSIKITVLVLLCFQNSGHALLTRYSRGILKEEYSSTEVVLVGEIFKMFVSGYFTMTDRSDSDAQGVGYRKLLWLTWNSQKIVLLVFFYALSNLLAYYALARVDASAYTVLLQLKILTTAGFAGCILDRYISSSKWRALILLVIGCILVASPTYNNGNDCEHINNNNNNKRSLTALEVDSPQRTGPYLRGLLHNAQDTNGVSLLETMLGFGSILVMNTLSGFSSIYFESMLKKTGEKITIWERNFQLAFYSIWLLLGILMWDLSSNPTANTFQLFKGWTILAWMIAFVQAGGGLLVAATLKYADSILKTLATSGSIVMSAVLGYLLLGGQLDIFILIGCITTILAIINYTFD